MSVLPTIDVLLRMTPLGPAWMVEDQDRVMKTAADTLKIYGGKKRFLPPKSKPDSLASHMVCAKTTLALAAHRLLHAPAMGLFLAWNGQRYAPGDEVASEIQPLVEDVCRMACGMKKAREKDMYEYNATGESEAFVRAVVALLKRDPRIQVSASDLDAIGELMGMDTGAGVTWDAKQGGAVPAQPKWLITRALRKGLTPKAGPAPKWDRFLDAVLAEFKEDAPAVRAYLQRHLGYCCTGDDPHRKILLIWGLGRNGKSTLMRTVTELLGTYAVGMPASAFAKDSYGARPNQATPDMMALEGCRLAVGFEASERLDVEALKAWTGGDAVSGRALYHGVRKIRTGAKLVFIANKEIQVPGADAAFADRLVMLPMEARLPDYSDESRPYWQVLVEEEGPAIMAWILEGARLVYAEGRLDAPGVLKRATKAFVQSADKLLQAMQAALVKDVDGEIRSKELYHTVEQAWLGSGGNPHDMPSARSRTFSARVKETFGARLLQDKEGSYWRGVRKRTLNDPLDDPTEGQKGTVVGLKERRKSPG